MRTPQSSASQIEVRANGRTFTALAEGPTDGPHALCLHGLPDSAHTWRHLLPELAAAGFRAVAPWMRGYAPTEVPADGSYGPGHLPPMGPGSRTRTGGSGLTRWCSNSVTAKGTPAFRIGTSRMA
jgi:pimeloyl-ACP methyl ester carboxylesterase